ncbi:hypothetical protein [Pontibacillus salipaludis]|uniref:Lipoprotein n=1 Tax=Pontibacillus salipaludis TaxID=1697394 RepID=A0ABQ1Q6U4_9BACI|nr:hypothetical protein [Pontibacillus salipaludis]GGD14863.1 hypothetical protein GCM10011389_23130 [Pontibacillus salipaludis]
MKKVVALLVLALPLIGCAANEEEGQKESTQMSEEHQANKEKKETISSQDDTENTSKENASKNTNDSGSSESNTSDQPTLSKKEAKQVALDYEEAITHTIKVMEDDNEENDYTSTSEITSYYKETMAEELATSNAEELFWTRDGKFQVKPRDGGLTLQPEQPFTLNELGDQTYEIVQERNNELIGHIKAHFKLTHNGNRWVMQEVTREELQ